MTLPKGYNFICVILGDNDFASAMLEGMRSLKEEADFGSLCPAIVKEFMTEFIVHYRKIRHILRGEHMTDEGETRLRTYISSKIRVLFNEKFPTDDYDGGAVYVDVNTGFVSTF